jgi:hypothetical protein
MNKMWKAQREKIFDPRPCRPSGITLFVLIIYLPPWHCIAFSFKLMTVKKGKNSGHILLLQCKT